MKVRLVSVPHSGTRFMRTLLDQVCDYTSHHTDDLGFPHPYHATDKVVVPLRDPMLAECSRLEGHMGGLPVTEWLKVAEWYGHPNVWYFRVDGPTDMRGYQLNMLGLFLRADVPQTDWEPVGVTVNNTLREKYEAGQIDSRLTPAWTFLRQSKEVYDLFHAHGYNLPWM